MPFATPEQVAARMGRDDFTGNDLEQVNALLEVATEDVTDAVGKTTAWATAMMTADDVPAALKNVTLEAVVRVLYNPAGARSTSEALGAYSTSLSFADAAVGLVLTDAERRRVRRAVHGATSGTARIGSVHDELYPYEGS